MNSGDQSMFDAANEQYERQSCDAYTPQTDALVASYASNVIEVSSGARKLYDFARKLEQERDSYREKAETLEREFYTLHSCSNNCQRPACVNRRKAEALDWLEKSVPPLLSAIQQAMKKQTP